MDSEKTEGRRPFLSALTSLLQSHGNDKPSDSLSRQSSVHSGVTANNKAVHTIGEGSFSLDDLDDSFNNSTREPSMKSALGASADMPRASAKKNSEFHKLFKEVSSSEPLIEDYSCAHTREILVQGRLYVTPAHVCFHSNILGRSTNLVISYQEIIEISPKNTAGLFPNGIVIRTLHAQHTFASFVNRTHVLKQLRSIKETEKQPESAFESGAESDDESDFSSGDDESFNEVSSFKRRKSSDSSFSFQSSRLGHSEDDYASSREGDKDPKHRSRSSTRGDKEKPKAVSTPKKGGDDESSGGAASGGAGAGAAGKYPVPNLGSDTHAPTSLPEMDSKEKMVDTMTVDSPLGVVANLLYGSDTTWYLQFQTRDLKNRELDSVPGFSDKDGKKQRYFEYVKPLSGPIGPKQTKCKVTETQEQWDMDKCVEVLIAVKTPDVPSGDAFTTYTKCTMVWAEGNKTTVRHTTWLEWTGKSWLKKPIETGAMDGQVQYCKILKESLYSKLRKNSGKTKKSKKRSSSKPVKVEPTRQSKFDVEMLMPVAYMAGALLGLYLLYILYHHFFGSKSREDALKEQLELWQWLNSRLETPDLDHMSEPLTNQEMENVIEFTEKRLERLRKIYQHRSR